ncbi:MAG TPA: glycosyltransferase [Solirubrobacteraceae bacterium]|nr:glycosyltransferase [Solirubrobacteraceae bacterium]
MRDVDILLVTLGTTAGLRRVDDELAGSLRRAGMEVEVARARPVREVRTFALLDLVQARAARHAAREALRDVRPRTILYSTTTAALLWPAPGAIHFDAPAAGNRPGRHGVWQRPLERRRFAAAPLVVAQDEGGLAEAPPHGEALVIPVPVEPSGPTNGERDVAAVTYAADAEKKGLDRVLAAWRAAARPGEELVVAGRDAPAGEGAPGAGGSAPDGAAAVRFAGLLSPSEFRGLLRRARVYVTAPRREDYGLAQLEALADGAMLVTTEAPGPYAALPIARDLDPRLVGDDLAAALRAALDDPREDYAERAKTEMVSFRRGSVDALVQRELLPRLVP